MSICVVFFGGFQASKTDMDLWLANARKQRDDVVFDAFPYPDAGPDDDDAVNGFKQFDAVIKKIKDTGADMTYIVGHSSGCAIANELDSRLTKNMKDTSHIALVCLDGFAPSADQRKRSTTQVWSAVGPGGKGQSFHWRSWAKQYTAAHATNKWSLHFSLVNTAANDDKIESNKDIKNGYSGCVANLCWLEKKK
jgi:predicted esterase